ncbi:hypothetical protein GCM10023215_17340 [Pseudonocardia yuanmonensis]|uniref:SnoaL-like domain-containing protein n=1 Tax=Pseudonocardia yuanmonensis TaxID=1095914 RepID=A0ABP8W9X4_9PSEU
MVEQIRAYVDGWNAHDGPTVLATFGPGGTYVDPSLPGPISDDAIAGYVAGLATAFPDLRFTVDELIVEGPRVVMPWRMQGTNTGPMPDLPEPTGRTCDVSGIDVITIGPDGISSIVGYFDQKTFADQLGL